MRIRAGKTAIRQDEQQKEAVRQNSKANRLSD